MGCPEDAPCKKPVVKVQVGLAGERHIRLGTLALELSHRNSRLEILLGELSLGVFVYERSIENLRLATIGFEYATYCS